MEAVVLAGGEGSRLRPLTERRPKPLLHVANKPIVEYVLDALVGAGIDRITVVVGYRGDRVRTHLGSSFRGVDLAYVTQENQLGSGHALLQARGTVTSDPFLVVNGDNVIDQAVVAETIATHEAGDAVATAAVATSEHPQDYGAVVADDGYIKKVIENPVDAPSHAVNAGVYVLPQAIFDALSETASRNGDLHLTDAMMNLTGRVRRAQSDGAWLDPSYPWELLDVTEELLREHGDMIGDTREPVVAESAQIHETAVVEAPVVLGEDCRLGPGAVVRRGSCLGENVRVGPGAVVTRSVAGADAEIGANAVLHDSVIGEGVTIGPGATLSTGEVDLPVAGRVYPVRIGSLFGDRASVGGNATCRPGTRFGTGASAAPGTIVRGTVEAEVEVI
jgi:glucose-1-phosphate thymidylyltransferase